MYQGHNSSSWLAEDNWEAQVHLCFWARTWLNDGSPVVSSRSRDLQCKASHWRAGRDGGLMGFLEPAWQMGTASTSIQPGSKSTGHKDCCSSKCLLTNCRLTRMCSPGQGYTLSSVSAQESCMSWSLGRASVLQRVRGKYRKKRIVLTVPASNSLCPAKLLRGPWKSPPYLQSRTAEAETCCTTNSCPYLINNQMSHFKIRLFFKLHPFLQFSVGNLA